MITTTRSFQLPQLSIKNINRSKERSNKPTIRSTNYFHDHSNSPPKTRTDGISRGSMSTPLQQCRFSYYNMCRVDQSFNDQDIFTASQKSVQRSSSINKIEKIDKLSQQIKTISADKQPNTISSNRETEPYIRQPRSPSLKKRTEGDSTVLNLKKQIKNRVADLYTQVQNIIKNHKGYVRQQEKKYIFVQLVQLKKEFKLLNQDYNEFYTGPSQIVFDFDIVDHMEQLRKLFDRKKYPKNNGSSLFDQDDISFIIPTESNEKTTNLVIPEVQEQDVEHSNDQIALNTDQMTDCSPTNSTSRRISKIPKRSTKLYQIQPIQIPQESPQEPIRRKSTIKTPLTPKTPTTPHSPSTSTSRNNKFTAQQVLQSKLNIPQTPPKIQENKIQFIEDKQNELKKQIQQRQSKLITRKATIDVQKEKLNRSRLNSKNSLREVSEQSENEQQQQQQQQQQQTIQDDQTEQQIIFIKENKNEITYQQPIMEKNEEKQQLIEKIKKKDKQAVQKEKIPQQIEFLFNCQYIYDSQVLMRYRKIKTKNMWNDDIESILSNQYQFF